MAVKYGACEPVVYHLRRSNLLDRGRLDQVLTAYMESQIPLEPAVMADYLIRQEILTPYQVKRVLQGKSENLVLGHYTIVEEIGFGSMGAVYKARSKNDSKTYALKLMPRRSMWNVRIAKRLVRKFGYIRHPAVVSFVDVNTVGSFLCLVWPFVEGETLEKLVQQKSRLLPGVAALFTLQAAEGLSVCHHQGLIHGLLKPANFLVGPNQEIRVLDFGTGALLTEAEGAELIDTMSTSNAVTSGLDCRSPENILDVKIRTPAGDQYSLGCVLYFCLTGRYPFAGETAVEKMLAHQVKEPTPIRSLRPEVPQPLVEIVHRLMQKTPEGRYPNLDEVIEVLRPLAVTPEVAGRLLAMDIPESPNSPGQIHEPVIEIQTAAKPPPGSIPDSKPIVGPQNEAALENQFEFEPIATNPVIPHPSRRIESSRKIRTLMAAGFFACIGLIIILLWVLWGR